jgi:hypothetical protein
MMEVEPSQKICIGQVKEIHLPQGWSKVEQPTADVSSLVVFTPAHELTSQLGFYYRGKPISQDDGAAFEKLLSEHKRALLPNELEKLRYVLADLADLEQFRIRSAEITNLSGRNVLVVEGRWLVSDSDTYEIFINAGDAGTIVQQIYFIAPKDKFYRQIKLIKEALKSIQWL